MSRTGISETYKADGIHAKGDGVVIQPYGGAYLVTTRAPSGSIHGVRYLRFCASYDAALDRANVWLTKTLPRRLRAERAK